MNSRNRLFALCLLIGIAFLGCGKSITSNPIDASASDKAAQSPSKVGQISVTGLADSGPTETPTLASKPSREEGSSNSPMSEPNHEAIKEQNQEPRAERKVEKEVRRVTDKKDLAPALDSSLPKESQPGKDATKKSHPRDVVARKSRGSLPFLMQECGYRYGYVFGGDLDRFVKAAIEPAQTGALEGRFRIATTIYRVPTSDQARNKADAFRLRSQFGNNGKADATEKDDRVDNDEITIQMALPFRLYKAESIDRERSKGVKGVQSVVVNRADLSVAWFLTKDDRLAKCNTPQETQLVVARGGSLFFGEGRETKLMFRGLDSNPRASELRNIPYSNFDPKSQATQDIVAEIEIERLTYGPALHWQTSWGYYRQEALIAEEMDSDFVLQWNLTGALTGMTPDYFRPTDSANPMVASAHLVSAVLRTKKGEEIASYQSEHEGSQPPKAENPLQTNKEPQETSAPVDADSVKTFLDKDSVCHEVLERRSLADFLKEHKTATKDNEQSDSAIKYVVYRESVYMYEFLDEKLFAIRFVVPRSFKSAEDWKAPYLKALGQPTNTTMPEDFREMKATKFLSWHLPKHNIRINFAHLPASLREADLDLFGQFINLDAALEYLGRKAL